MKIVWSSILLGSIMIAVGCASSEGDPAKQDGNLKPGAPPGGPAAATTAPPVAQKFAPLPERQPVMAMRAVSRPAEVIDAGPFTGEEPTIRANDRHATPVTGQDCMTCHGTGGTAPHFAFAGTIALGKKWTWGTPTWSSAGNGYDSYDGYGSYESDDGYGTFGGGGGDGRYDSYGTSSDSYGACTDDDGYGSYDNGGYGGFGYRDYDDYGDYGDDNYGGGGCGTSRTRGWPEDRSAPSPKTGVRLIGSDGYIFDTVTDSDGNFWFRGPADVKTPAFTGIRYGTFTVTGDTNGVACASCHESGKADSPGRLWTWDGPTPRQQGSGW